MLNKRTKQVKQLETDLKSLAIQVTGYALCVTFLRLVFSFFKKNRFEEEDVDAQLDTIDTEHLKELNLEQLQKEAAKLESNFSMIHRRTMPLT
jgi:hypothetical protein